MVTARVARVLAPNPSPMTLDGTNSYLVYGSGTAIAIDPGPAHAAHVRNIVATARARGAAIEAIAVTHGHPDHAPGAALLHAATGAPVYAHAGARFPFDRAAGDGDRIVAGDVALDAIATPGHTPDHLAFALGRIALFTGDTIVGRGTVVIAPPHGDMRVYQRTLRRLRDEFADVGTIYGGHGEPIETPAAKIDEYIAHREARERDLIATLRDGERTIPAIVAHLYRDVASALWPVAARQVLATLIALEREGRVRSRALERAPDAHEAAILNPDLGRIADPASAAVARAELGIDRTHVRLDAYALLPLAESEG